MNEHFVSVCKDKNIVDVFVRNVFVKKEANRNSTSGIRGVSFDKQKNKWRAHIELNGKQYNLGRYHKIEEAQRIREIAETMLNNKFIEWYKQRDFANNS